MTRRIVVCLLLLAVLACGKRGDPRPPVPIIPKATSDLLVTQRADQVILSWSYPSLTTAGRSLTDIRRISVYRYIEELPPSAVTDVDTPLPVDLDPAVPRPVALFSKIPTIPQAQFAKLATVVDSIEGANLAEATEGAKLLFTDRPPLLAIDGRPIRVTYAVVTEGESARSDFSNLVVIVPLPVAVPPAGLTATAKPEGVVLTWERPAESVRGYGEPVIEGYNIYRSAPGENNGELPAPINTAPVTETTFTDVPAYGEHQYRVTAVATLGPPLVASEPSAIVRVTFVDLVPPAAPGSLTPLVESNAIRLIWTPVTAPDLAGYKLYRMEGIGHVDIRDAGEIPVVIQPIAETTFLHTPVSQGIAFRYAVTAVDKSGNESARTWTDWVVVPKTP